MRSYCALLVTHEAEQLAAALESAGSLGIRQESLLRHTRSPLSGVMNPMAMADLSDNESKIFGPSNLRDMAALEGRIKTMAGVGEADVFMPKGEQETTADVFRRMRDRLGHEGLRSR
mgnify:CR=1 FL=1